jgi:hypothetical protein
MRFQVLTTTSMKMITFWDIASRVVLLKLTEILEVHTASKIRALMAVVCTSETSDCFNESTRRYIPESCHLQRFFFSDREML